MIAVISIMRMGWLYKTRINDTLNTNQVLALDKLEFIINMHLLWNSSKCNKDEADKIIILPGSILHCIYLSRIALNPDVTHGHIAPVINYT